MYLTCRKRVVKLKDREIDFGCWYLNSFIQLDSHAVYEVIAKAWTRLMELWRSDSESFTALADIIGIDNMMVKEIWNVVNVEIKYRYDDPVFQTPDFWMLADEVWTQRHGDCEDSSYLLASAVERWIRSPVVPRFSKETKVYACIGFYVDVKGKYYGHGFVIYRNPRVYDGWLWLESTFESTVPQYIWYVADFDHLVPVYFFNSKESYRIDKDYEVLGLTEDYVKKHEQYIKAMIDYVEAGKWLKLKWMHKGRRTPDIIKQIVIK